MRGGFLVTNDDGYESRFLWVLVEALASHGPVAVAAPEQEQSWVGRSVSRRRDVRVRKVTGRPQQTWAIDGTPTDCVNIALTHLLQDCPLAVVSGINIGYNASSNLIYSSGTVAGAMEGAFWGIPAFAVSQQVPDALFHEVSANKGELPSPLAQALRANARHAADWIAEWLRQPPAPASGNGHRDPADAIVHNLNYPITPRQPYELIRTVPVALAGMPLYREHQPGSYRFAFEHGRALPSPMLTDRDAILDGCVSHSVLNFSALGRDLRH